MRFSIFLSVVIAVTLTVVCQAGDWLNFRGPNFAGVAEGPVPLEWDAASGKNIAWKVPLPGKGPASPIVVGDRVIVTASSGPKQDRLHVICFAAADGKKLWERQFWATGRTMCHPTSAVAANSPPSRKNQSPRILYATQVATEPPTIVIKCNDARLFTDSWKRYLLGELRKRLPFAEVPIKLYFRSRPEEDAEEARPAAPTRRRVSRRA